MADERQRPRITFDCPERLRRAIWFRAVAMGLNSPTEAIVSILEDNLEDELKMADESIAKGGPAPKSKRGRKPKRG